MNTTTLAQRLAEGRIPVPDALRYAMQLADALRKLHEEGHVHGAVSPVSIALNNNAVELMPAMVPAGAATPYAAPEVIKGQTPDARSDIFSFGTVVYEMLTGKRAFEGADRAKPSPSGSPAVDRFVANCVAPDPQARLQNMRRVMLEIKLLNAAARRAETPAGGRSNVTEVALRAEIHQMEARVNTRLQEQQKFVGEMQHAVTEAVASLRGQLAAVSNELNSARGRSQDVEQSIEAAGERIVSHVQQGMDSISERITSVQFGVDAASVRISGLEQGIQSVNARIDHLEQKEAPAPVPQVPDHVHEAIEASAQRIAALEQSVEAAHQKVAEVENRPVAPSSSPDLEDKIKILVSRLAQMEQAIDGVSHHTADLHETVSTELQNFEKTLHTQSVSIESARTAMAQTDDLVERVVEALESLQTIVLEQSGDRAVTLS